VVDPLSSPLPQTDAVRPAGPGPAARRPDRTPAGAPFSEVLREKVAARPLSFSGHALERIQRRGIDVGEQTLDRLEAGVARAAAKGSRSSLVLLDGTAFVVSVQNRTVITAVDREHMKEQVFTNIDSAVLA
jgi:flagellar operon protein